VVERAPPGKMWWRKKASTLKLMDYPFKKRFRFKSGLCATRADYIEHQSVYKAHEIRPASLQPGSLLGGRAKIAKKIQATVSSFLWEMIINACTATCKLTSGV